MYRGIFLVFAMLASSCLQAGGQFQLGYAHGALNGFEVGGGFAQRFGDLVLAENIFSGVFYSQDSDPRYRSETFSNGQTVCRDHSNGQFANKEKCASTISFEYAPSIEIGYEIEGITLVGAGYKAGVYESPYFIVQASMGNRAYLAINAGPDYQGVSVMGRF